MEESDLNLSTPTTLPPPKKKRGRPRGSYRKTPLPKKQKTASSPAATVKRTRRHGTSSPIEEQENTPPEPLNSQSQLLTTLIDLLRKVVDELESINKDRNVNQGDGGMTPVYYDPQVSSEAGQTFPGSGDYSADPIDLTGKNKAPVPRQTRGEVDEPRFAHPAQGSASEEVKINT